MTIYNTIRKHKKAFGRAINPYLFRDTAATTLAIADPTIARVRLRLAIRIFTTSERYDQQAQSFDARRAYITALYAKRKRHETPQTDTGLVLNQDIAPSRSASPRSRAQVSDSGAMEQHCSRF
jgi:hypothetical protein